MGGRGNSGLRNSNPAPVEFKYDEPVLEAGKPTRYSREIFTQNYREARNLAKAHEATEPFGMRNLYWSDDNPLMSKQALKGVQKLINDEKRNIDIDVDFGILTPEDAQKRRLALNAVQRTLNEQWNNQ